MTEEQPSSLLQQVCRHLPSELARTLLEAEHDEQDKHSALVEAFTAIKGHGLVLPEDLHRELSTAVAALVRITGSEHAADVTSPLPAGSVTTQKIGEVQVVDLVGELDLSMIEDLRTTFTTVITSSSPRVVVNLAGATFLDSIILGSLVAARRRSEDLGGWLRLAAPRTNVRHVIRLTGLDQVFEIVDDLETATT